MRENRTLRLTWRELETWPWSSECGPKRKRWNYHRRLPCARLLSTLPVSGSGGSPQPGGLIFHSDRGSQYASEDFRAVMEKHGIVASMSRKGNCWDNAVTETLFGSLKTERLHGETFISVRAAKDTVMNWILWYNQKRMHSTIGYQSPMEFEKAWRQEQLKVAA